MSNSFDSSEIPGLMNAMTSIASNVITNTASASKRVVSTGTKVVTTGVDVVSDFMHYKHEWVKIDKSETNNVKNNTQVKKPSVPKNLKCFFCKKKGDHWPKDCDLKKKKGKGHDVKNESDEGVCPQTGILVIGNCGTGKSSIIKLLSGIDTKISHGSERGTDETSIITSKYNENIHFIDSVGLQDQNIKWKDSNILKKTLKYLHFAKLDSLKIIFCIAGDTGTRQGLFTEVANFIQTLKVEEDTNESNESQSYNPTDEEYKENEENFWNSVLIVKKGAITGIDSEKFSEFSGVFAAAKTNGASEEFKSAKHIFGFTCYEWNSEVKENKVFKKLETNEYEEYGYYSAQSAKRNIEDKLGSLSSFKLKFRHEKCVKCGVNGDSRYIIAPCHTKVDYFHDKPLAAKHTGKEEYIHSGDLVDVKFLTKQKRHDGRKMAVHQPPFATVKYHPGPFTTSHTKRAQAKKFTFGISEWMWKDKEWRLCCGCNEYVSDFQDSKKTNKYVYECCDKKTNERWFTSTKGCKNKYECCGKNEENEQCSKEANRKWSCCGQSWNSNGCKNIKITEIKQRYTCCRQKKESKGHDLIYSCCEEAGDGCKFYYPCCNKGPQANGCKRKCMNCRKNWGNGSGCVGAV